MLMQLFCEYCVKMMNLLDILFVVQVPSLKKNIQLIYIVHNYQIFYLYFAMHILSKMKITS